MTIKGMMTEPLHIWGIYAPVKTTLEVDGETERRNEEEKGDESDRG